jgi:ribose transport system substrate-binding protein
VLGGVLLATLSGCASSEKDSGSAPVIEDACLTHEMRPTRLFDIVDGLKPLSQDVADPSEKSVYVIPGHWSPFWSTPKTGFIQAKDEMGFSGELKAACNAGDASCIEDQQHLFNDLTDGDASNGEADGIAIGVKGADAMEPLITQAATHIPIITFDADVTGGPSTGRELYLGAMNIPAGVSAGQTMLGLLKDGGTFHLYASSLSAANLMERAAGVFAECLGTTFSSAADFQSSEYCSELATTHTCKADCKGRYAGATAIADAYADEFKDDSDFKSKNPDATAEDYLAYTLNQLLTSDSPPAGLISLHGTPSPILEKAISDNDSGATVQYVAWDFSAEVQAGLQKGTVDAAMVQNSYFYGYLSAHITYAMIAAGRQTAMDVLAPYFESNRSDHLLDTGMTVVTVDNLDRYSSYQEECLGLTSG